MSKGVTTVSGPDLETLLREVELGRLECPLTETGLMAAGLGHVVGRLGALSDLGQAGVEAVVQTALAEREHRPRPSLDLVWTGREPRVSETRDTAVVVRQLFAKAKRSVIIAGYSFDHGVDILRPLHEAMVEHGLEALLFLNVDGNARSQSDAEQVVGAAVESFLSENWPFGEPYPHIFYDPRTAIFGSGVSLHAKCVVVDERYALVGSANFTDRGQTRSIEVGVLIDDEDFALGLAGQWRGLISAGLVARAVGR